MKFWLFIFYVLTSSSFSQVQSSLGRTLPGPVNFRHCLAALQGMWPFLASILPGHPPHIHRINFNNIFSLIQYIKPNISLTPNISKILSFSNLQFFFLRDGEPGSCPVFLRHMNWLLGNRIKWDSLLLEGRTSWVSKGLCKRGLRRGQGVWCKCSLGWIHYGHRKAPEWSEEVVECCKACTGCAC